jgi:hypothetical protein
VISALLFAIACGAGPKIEPTPLGMVGQPYDFRHLLPAEVEAPAALTTETIDGGHVLQLRERGNDTTVRVLAWGASDEQTPFGPSYLSAVCVEVMENPNGSQVTWKASNPKPAESVRLEINVAWVEEGRLMELWLPGVVDNKKGATFVPDGS